MKWKYISHAFWLRWPLPIVGQLPLNVMAVGACWLLGFQQSGFWWLGLGLEFAYLWSVAGNPRFHKVVDAAELPTAALTREAAPLFPESQLRIAALERQHANIAKSYANYAPGEATTAKENLRHLRQLIGIYTGLLQAKQHLSGPPAAETERDLTQKAAALSAELENPALTAKLKSSKEETYRLLRQRLLILQDKANSLDEIESDLERIDTQFQLAEESASLHAKPTLLSLELDFASKMDVPFLLGV